MKTWFLGILVFLSVPAFGAKEIVNVYAWSGEIPDAVITQFQKETGITVNFSTYDSNETLYAKLKAVNNPSYDVIEPSSYYVDRMRREGMLEPLDLSKITNIQYIDPEFLNGDYDPQNKYSMPNLWGVTGIFVNKKYFDPATIQRWSDLWEPRFANQLLLLDDVREVLPMAMMSLGFSANDSNPTDIKLAYEHLLQLRNNIKLFVSDAAASIITDEDATVGMTWNGDLYRAQLDNPNLVFIYPKDGFVIWVDCFAIPKNAPHYQNALKFINFMMRPDIALQSSMAYYYATPNLAAQKLMPANIRTSSIIYPSHDILKNGQFQTDLSEQSLNLYAQYWEMLKLKM
ncbi:MAG: spermidine/putrescine ABC transporter substrate-binding protein [Legionellales bacterium]|nr:spermidine/putrescine ABC transporter substrate-binding protein [Legionellales bacterium]